MTGGIEERETTPYENHASTDPDPGTTFRGAPMSAEAVGWVYKHSPYTGAKFSVHLAIADSANDVNDYQFWMALGKLGRKARVGRQAVSASVATMVKDGMLEVIRQSEGGRNRPSVYRFLMPDVALVWHWNWSDETVASDDSRPGETVASASQTVASRTETVVHGDTRRTQREPNEPRFVSLVCRECSTDGFTTADALADHVEFDCPAMHANDGDFATAREALRKAGGRG